MEEKNKVFVFEKKEVALIFIFMILIGVTSFTLGVRIGKKMLFSSVGITEEDLRSLKLKSQQEENVESVVKEIQGKTPSKEELSQDAFSKLQKEMEEIDKGQGAPKPDSNVAPEVTPEKTSVSTDAEKKSDVVMMSKDEEEGSFKYTIQLGSHPKLSEAKEFADAFTVRGYNPIINQVKVGGKLWYRVSLGTFNSVVEAKDYIKKEDSLFQGQEFVIVEMK